MQESVMLYHWWWNHPPDCVINNWNSPIIFAICSFRHYNPFTPIHVLDVSEVDHNWQDFPKKFNFVLHRRRGFPHKFPMLQKAVYGLMPQRIRYDKRIDAAWKIFDLEELVKELPQSKVIFSDSDIFFLKPLTCEYNQQFCCNANTGFFYYQRSSLMDRFFALWKNHTLMHIVGNDLIGADILGRTNYDKADPNEEIVFQYLLSEYPQFVAPLRQHYVYCFDGQKYGFDPFGSESEFIHFAGFHVPRGNRLIPFIVFREYREILNSYVDLNSYLAQMVIEPRTSLSVYDPHRSLAHVRMTKQVRLY